MPFIGAFGLFRDFIRLIDRKPEAPIKGIFLVLGKPFLIHEVLNDLLYWEEELKKYEQNGKRSIRS